MGYLSNVKKQYIISFFYSLIPAYVIERLFWQQRGMTVRTVVYCEMIYALTVTVCEVPSGILSDKFGRKKLLVLCGATAVLELVLLLYAYNFFQFALAIVFAGIGKALASGSENALLYDSLLQEKKEEGFEKMLGRLSAVDFAGSVLAALCGSVLAGLFDYELNYVLSIGSCAIAFIVTLTLKEPPLATKPEEAGALPYLKSAVKFFRTNPLVFVYCLTGAVLGACMIYLDEFWQILLNDVGVAVVFFGIVSAGMLSVRIPGNLLAYKLKEKFDYKAVLTFVMIVNILGYAAVALIRSPLCLIPVSFVCLAAGVVDPLISGFLHHRAESGFRATVESVSSLGLRIVSAGAGLFFGYISSRFSIFAGFMALAVICLGYFIFFRRITARETFG